MYTTPPSMNPVYAATDSVIHIMYTIIYLNSHVGTERYHYFNSCPYAFKY